MSPRCAAYGLALGTGICAVTLAVAPTPPSLIEQAYSLTVYPRLQRIVTPISNSLPFALLDVLIVGCVGVLVAICARTMRRCRREGSVRPAVAGVMLVSVLTAAGYIAFLGLWGLNYRRIPMADRVRMEDRAVDAEAVRALGVEAVQALNALHNEAHRSGWGLESTAEPSLVGAAATVHEALAGSAAVPGRLKTSLFAFYFRWAGVDGMVNPFGLEVIGNPDLLPFERPFVAAHEWAHLAGFAHEAEASYVGVLTCMLADVPAQYSGWLFVYWQVTGEADRATVRALQEQLDDGPRRDIDAVIARLRRGELPQVRLASWRIYDQYLRANRVTSGVRSYGEVLTLLVRARRETGWMPVRTGSGG